MVDEVFISIGGVIGRDTFQAREEATRIDANETIHADVADVCGFLRDAVLDVAQLFDVFATGAIIPIFVDFNTDQTPLTFGLCKRPGMRQREDVCFEAFEVVSTLIHCENP